MPPSPTPFLSCTMCEACWPDIESIITDETLEVCGYQARFDEPTQGMILITHMADGCRTTLGVGVAQLAPLYRGPVYTERKTGTDECGGLCLFEHRLEECEAECDMAWVRRVIQAMRKHELP